MAKPDKPAGRVETADLGIGGEIRRLILDVPPHAGVRRLAHASFQLFGDAIEPEFWNSYFGCSATHFHRKGDSCGPDGAEYSPSGRRYGRHKFSCWSISSEYRVDSDLLEPHVAYLVEALGLPRSGFAGLIREQSLTTRVFCFWDNSTGDRVPVVGVDVLQVLQMSDTPLEIDEYPQEIGVIDGDTRYKAWI
jgi:hypothetical protein